MKIEGCRRKEDGVVEEGWPGESGKWKGSRNYLERHCVSGRRVASI